MHPWMVQVLSTGLQLLARELPPFPGHVKYWGVLLAGIVT